MIIKTPEQHLQEIRNKAIIRGGKLISDKWVDSYYEFEDVNGNRFFCSGASIKSGSWCKEGLVTEPLCRQVIEHLYQENFPSTFQILTAKLLNRPRPLELDGYCNKLKIAFEYQGHKSHWFPEHPRFKEVTIKDAIKKKNCKKLEIHLIIPPILEKKDKWSSENIYNHVFKAVTKSYKKLDIPYLNKNEFKADLTKNNHGLKKISEMMDFCKIHKGKIISSIWLGAHALHTFQFEDGRNFQMCPDALKRGWPKDADFFLRTSEDRYDDFKKIIEDNGATLIEKQWKGCESRHRVKLSCGTEINIIPESIRKGGWVKAPNRYLTKNERLNKFIKIAKQNKGEILETKWLGKHMSHKIILR